MQETTFNWNQAKQLSLWQVILATAVPSAGGFFGFHIVLPFLVKGGLPVMVAWPMLAFMGLSLIVIAAFILLKNESAHAGITLASRMCIKKITGKTWLVTSGLIVLLVILMPILLKVTVILIQNFQINIPSYMPFFLKPEIDPMQASMAELSPGLNLSGQYWVLPVMAVVLLINILAEELYFRAWMLPKLSHFGYKSWIINGTLFACYHSFQIWLFPILLFGSLVFAFIFYYSKSIWPSFVGHFVLNFIFSLVGILLLIMK